MKRILKHSFITFAIVGGIGFLVDLTCMVLLSIWFPPVIARSIAFWAAASSNWWWNRTITFAHKYDFTLADSQNISKPTNKKAAALQWLQFLGGSMVAFIPNVGCYLLLIGYPSTSFSPTLNQLWPYLAMMPGIAIGMIFNYVFSRFWVFKIKHL
jgi:putative flippase GtrA